MNRQKRSSSIAIISLLAGLLAFQIYTFFSVEHCPTRGDSPVLFDFNPNTISHDSLLLLGFSDAQARGIENYRCKGGKFRRKEDFARMYTVSPEKYQELEAFIVIPDIYGSSSERRLNHTAGNHSNGYNDYRNGRRPYGRNIYQRREWKEYDTMQRTREFRRDTDSLQQAMVRTWRTDTIDLNFADSADLTSLRGIGAYYAGKIMEYRNRLGFFYCDSQLLEISGIDSVRFEGLRSRVTVNALSEHIYAAEQYMEDTISTMNDGIGKGSIKGIDTRMPLADLSEKEMAAHPYIGAFAARSMSFIRKKYGAAALTVENLLHQGVITAALARKLSHYFK